MNGKISVYISDQPVTDLADFFGDIYSCNQISKDFDDDESAIEFAKSMRNQGFFVAIILSGSNKSREQTDPKSC